MPDAGDLYASVGYLTAAAAITIVALAGYTLLLSQRLSAAQAKNLGLRGIHHGGTENTE
jgi:hypothetical protein